MLLAEHLDDTDSNEDEIETTGIELHDEINHFNGYCQRKVTPTDVVPAQRIVKKVDGDPVQDSINSLNYIHLFDKIMSLKLNQNKLRKEYSPQLRTEIGKIIIESTIE